MHMHPVTHRLSIPTTCNSRSRRSNLLHKRIRSRLLSWQLHPIRWNSFCSSSGNIGCEIVAFAEGALNKVRKSADVGETELGFRWQVVKSKFLLDYPIVFQAGPESDQPIFQKVKLALKMVENNLNLDSSNILFNNTFRSKPEEFLDEKLVKEEFKKLKKTPTKRPTQNDDDDDDEDFDDAPFKEYTAEILLDPEFQKSSGRTALLFCQFKI